MNDIPLGAPGLASGIDTEDYTQHALLLSTSPPLITESFTLKKTADAAVTHKLGTVMALDATGAIHQAADSTNRTDDGCARVVLAGQYTQPASTGADIQCQAYIQGHFNIDALTWNAAFNTDAKKLAAFDSNGVDDFQNPGTIKVGVNHYHRAS